MTDQTLTLADVRGRVANIAAHQFANNRRACFAEDRSGLIYMVHLNPDNELITRRMEAHWSLRGLAACYDRD